MPQEVQRDQRHDLHSRKLAIRDYHAVIALFCNGVKGTSALQMSRDMNINPKSAFVLLHKLREAMGAEIAAGSELSGEVEVDGAYFGSRTRPENHKADRRQQRREDSKRQVVAVARERGGNARTWVVGREADAIPMIRQNVASGTTVHADESASWGILHASFPMKRVNHSVEFASADGACTKQAESYFARLRRSEFGIHHRIAGRHLLAYSRECAWRENHRRQANGTHWNLITAAALASSQEHGMGGLLAPEGSMSEHGNDHALSRLIAMRAELAATVAELERELDRRRADLTHVDGTLRLMRADLDPTAIPPKRPYRRSRYFTRNELWRLSLNTLRLTNGEPLTAEEITLRIMKAKGLDARDESLLATVRAQVGSVLKRLHRRQVAAPSSKGKGATWRLLPSE